MPMYSKAQVRASLLRIAEEHGGDSVEILTIDERYAIMRELLNDVSALMVPCRAGLASEVEALQDRIEYGCRASRGPLLEAGHHPRPSNCPPLRRR